VTIFTPLQISRALSKLDRLGPSDPLPVLEGSRPVGSAFRIGITGPLGAGKSSLINEIVRTYRKRGQTVGVIAIDPSSPFTGGALLGDRVRMGDSSGDSGVFIRSLATRGSSGGLTVVAVDAADLLDMAGFDLVIIETVGVGQVEVDIVGACDLTVVVLEPSSGDMIQTMKAGLMEIADLFVVNKKDLRGFERYITDLEMALDMREWKRRPGVLATLARTGDGIAEMVNWMEEWSTRTREDGTQDERRKAQRSDRIRRAAEAILVKEFWEETGHGEVETLVAEGITERLTAKRLVEGFLKR